MKILFSILFSVLFVFFIQMIFSHLSAAEYVERKSDVLKVTDAQLKSTYWLALQRKKQINAKAVLINKDGIGQFNRQLIKNSSHVIKPLSMPDVLDKKQLIKLINTISSVPHSARFYQDGSKVVEKDFNAYRASVNIDSVLAQNKVRWGLVVKRTSLRKFPTIDRVFNDAMDKDLDRFQETGAFPGESVAVLHESKDKEWYLVRSYNYLAWVSQKDIAIGEKETVNNFVNSADFLIVTGDKVFTAFVPNKAEVSEIQLDMGVKLPLINADKHAKSLYGQNPYASHIVQLPIRNSQGKLELFPAMIAKNKDINIGYLAFSKANIIKQAFKFLGERYGWGHDYNGRDCTGFVGEIYKTFGLLMPRNSGQQGKANYGNSIDFTSQSSKQNKLAALAKLEVGDLLYLPGHVVMYLGHDNGQPYVIHDVKGLAYYTEDKEFYRGTLNGVSVTPLLPLQLSKTKSYLDKIYNIKQIRL